MISEETKQKIPNLNLKLQKQLSSQQLPTWMSRYWVGREGGIIPIPSSTPMTAKNDFILLPGIHS